MTINVEKTAGFLEINFLALHRSIQDVKRRLLQNRGLKSISKAIREGKGQSEVTKHNNSFLTQKLR